MALKMGVLTAISSIYIVMMMTMSTVLWDGMRVAAQPSSGSSDDSRCTNVLINISPCLNYITGNSSSSSTPSSSCCSQLASVVRSQPQCLCQVLNGGGSSSSLGGLNINKTQALVLPSACNVQTPSITQCNRSTVSDKPIPSSPGTINSSGGSSMKLPLLTLVAVTMAVSLIYSF